MQHLGTEDEMQQAWHDLLAGLSPSEILEHAPQTVRDLLATLPPEERLAGLSPEERLEGLTPAEVDRLRLMLQQPPKKSDTSSPK
jgi:hypothetical protein